MSWLHRAACRDVDPEWFFPTHDPPGTAAGREVARRAQELCASCPVVAPCLEWALESGQSHGVWGGTTPETRRELRRRRVSGSRPSVADGAGRERPFGPAPAHPPPGH